MTKVLVQERRAFIYFFRRLLLDRKRRVLGKYLYLQRSNWRPTHHLLQENKDLFSESRRTQGARHVKSKKR